MCELRKRGVESAVICSEPFVGLAKTQARVFGVPDLPLIVIPHPLGGLDMKGVEARLEVALPQALKIIREVLK